MKDMEALTHAVGDHPTPANMPKVKRADPVKRRGRAFGLGERNPKTLPSLSEPGGETPEENNRRTAYWTRMGKLARANRFIGSKY